MDTINVADSGTYNVLHVAVDNDHAITASGVVKAQDFETDGVKFSDLGASSKLFDLMLQGKTPENAQGEFMTAIFKLPWVENDNLKALETYKRLKIIIKGMGL